MPSVIGKIISFEGAFSIKGLDGSVRKALLGDNIYEGEVLIGDKNNTPLNNIEISISDASTIVIRGQEKQLFDASLATREFTKEETITQKDSIEAMLEASGDLEEIQELETAAGEEVVTESSGTAEAAFAELNNASVNVSADLRQRAFDANDGFNNFDDGEDARRSELVDITIDPTTSKITDDTNSGSKTDTITNDSTPTISGTAEAGATVVITDSAGKIVGKGVSNASGNYLITTSPLPEGSNDLIVTATDSAGNSASTSQNVTVDTSAESGVVTIDTIAGDDILNAQELNEAIQTVSGTAAGGDISEGDTVTVTINGVEHTTTVSSDGRYSVDVATDDLAANGAVYVSVTSTDLAGNIVESTVSSVVTVDDIADALDDIATTDEDSSIIINVLANDEADSTITSVETPLNASGEALGSVEIVMVDGVEQIKFTPAENFDTLNAGESSDVSFTYSIKDALGNDGSATTTVTIEGLNNDLTYVSESASYKNVVGIYEVGADGKPVSGTVVIDDQNGLVSGTHLADLDPNKDYDFFIIANGANEINENSIITFDNSGEKPILLINGNAASHPVYFTEPTFNPDGEDHFKFELDGNGGTTIKIEDLPNLGDADFGDVVLHTNFEMANRIAVDADLADVSDTGASNTDNITSDKTPTITGNTEQGANVVITNNGVIVGSGVADRFGDYSITTTALEDGVQELFITATDADGNSAQTTQVITIDTVAPDAPVITNITDNAGDYSSVTLFGTGEPGATISLYSKDGSTTAGNNTNLNDYTEVDTSASPIIVDSSGNWSLDISNLPNTPVNDNEFFKAVQTDVAGNDSVESNRAHFWHGTWTNVQTEVEDDFILMGSGNDTIVINDNDIDDRVVVDGGNGTDTAKFSGNFSNYIITTDANGNTIVTESVASDSDGDGIGDVNELRNFEIIKFADGTYDVAAGLFYTVKEGTTTETLEVEVPFLLGTKDLNSGSVSDWHADGVTISATNSRGNTTVGFDNHSQLSSTHQGIGLGVGGGDNNQIDKNEKLTLTFDNPVKSGAEIGISGMGGHFVEDSSVDAAAHWVAYRNDVEVSSGDVQVDSTGKTADDTSFTVDATFDRIEFSVSFMDNSTTNSNYSLKYIDGEYLTEVEQTVDFDTLLIADDSIDLSGIANNSDIANNIEHLDLANGVSQRVTLKIEDIMDMTDNNNTLRIDGDSSDHINLDTITDSDPSGDWRSGETVLIDNQEYSRYTGEIGGDSVTLEVSVNIQVDES